MPATIRDQILTHLRTNRSASVSEMAASLGVTRADIRYHLNALLDERLVEAIAAPDAPARAGRGRPAARFQLTGRSTPENYQALVFALLRLHLKGNNLSQQEVAAALVDQVFGSPQMSPLPLVQVLNNLVAELNRHHYQAHWEAQRAGPGIFFENCPYAGVVSEFPLLCEMDRLFLSQSAGMLAEQLQRIDKSRRKPPACLFRLKSD